MMWCAKNHVRLQLDDILKIDRNKVSDLQKQLTELIKKLQYLESFSICI